MAGIVHIFHAGRRCDAPNLSNSIQQKNFMSVFTLDLMTSTTLSVRPCSHACHVVMVEEQILIALCFYACGTFYQVITDGMGVYTTTVGEVVIDVSAALASLLEHFFTFPGDGHIAQVKQKFFLLGNMTNTIGVIDCTHVHIQAPHEREWEYVNR